MSPSSADYLLMQLYLGLKLPQPLNQVCAFGEMLQSIQEVRTKKPFQGIFREQLKISIAFHVSYMPDFFWEIA